MASFPAQLKKHVRNTIGHTKVVPGLYQHLDYPDVASLAMPTPMLVMNGTKDGLFDLDGVKASFAKLNACHAKAGVPDHCRTRFYETPHEFNARCRPRRGRGWSGGCEGVGKLDRFIRFCAARLNGREWSERSPSS